MSVLHTLVGGALALPTSGAYPTLAALAPLRCIVNVLEDKMYVRVRFQATLDDALPASHAFGLSIDGVVVDALPQVYAELLGALNGVTIQFEHFAKLTKGSHLFQIVADASAAVNAIAPALAIPKFLVERVSNDAVVSRSDEAKWKNVY